VPCAKCAGPMNLQFGAPAMKEQRPQSTSQPELADDLLRGADEIAKFLFGPNGCRRKVYYLAACTRIPVFRLGSQLCARRSVLLTWIAEQESRALPDPVRLIRSAR
jgi:hypothetical protein